MMTDNGDAFAAPAETTATLGLEMLMNPNKKSSSWDDRVERASQASLPASDHAEIRVNKEFYDELLPPRYSPDPVSASDWKPAEPKYAPVPPPFRAPSVMSKDTDIVQSADYRSDYRAPEYPRSAEDILNMKRDLLYKFNRLEKKGFVLPKKFTLNSSYEEMKLEFERVYRDREIDNSVRLQRNILLTAVSTLEFVNNKFDPFDLKLDGWSESVTDKIHEYDEVFEELHDKYRGRGSLPPEIKLLMMLCGSAFMHHLTSTMFKNHRASAQEVFNENPDLARNFAAATAANMSRKDPSGMAGMFSNLFGGAFGGEPRSAAAPPTARMSGPGDLRDIFAMAQEPDYPRFAPGGDPTRVVPSPPSNQHLQDANNAATGGESDKMSVGIEILSEIASDISDDTKFPDTDSILMPPKRRRKKKELVL